MGMMMMFAMSPQQNAYSENDSNTRSKTATNTQNIE